MDAVAPQRDGCAVQQQVTSPYSVSVIVCHLFHSQFIRPSYVSCIHSSPSASGERVPA